MYVIKGGTCINCAAAAAAARSGVMPPILYLKLSRRRTISKIEKNATRPNASRDAPKSMDNDILHTGYREIRTIQIGKADLVPLTAGSRQKIPATAIDHVWGLALRVERRSTGLVFLPVMVSGSPHGSGKARGRAVDGTLTE